jgi:hypothetical protein
MYYVSFTYRFHGKSLADFNQGASSASLNLAGPTYINWTNTLPFPSCMCTGYYASDDGDLPDGYYWWTFYPVYQDTEYHFGGVIEVTDGSGDITEWELDPESPDPGQATSPSPADNATGLPTTPFSLSWSGGDPAADMYVWYFGETSGDLALQGVLASPEAQVPHAMTQGAEYFWRVDTVLGGKVTQGVEWSFTTYAFTPPADVVTHRRMVAAADNKIWYEDL